MLGAGQSVTQERSRFSSPLSKAPGALNFSAYPGDQDETISSERSMRFAACHRSSILSRLAS